jgi:hypothetical protein
MVPLLLRAEDGEEEPQVCLVATQDSGPTEAGSKRRSRRMRPVWWT